MAFNFISTYTGAFHGGGPDDDATAITFRPVIPFRAFGAQNILRLTLPYHVDGRGEDGLEPVTIFDLVIQQEDWGRWGVGGVMTLASPGAAADEFAIGPAVGAVWKLSDELSIGAFNQNVFAGNTAVSQIQPIVSYQLGGGWALSSGDLQFAYDWEDLRFVSVPLGFQIGQVTRIGSQPVRWSINPQYNFADHDGLPEWQVALTLTLLAPSS